MSQNPTIVTLREDLLGDTPSAGLITPVISLLDDTDRDELMDALTKNETDQEPGKRCKDLIIAAADYGGLTPLQKHRAKMLCDRLFQYRDTIAGDAAAVNDLRNVIVGQDGTINKGSIDAALAEVGANIAAINAEMANVNDNPENNQTISDKISQCMSNITATIGNCIKAVGAGAGAAARGVRDGVRDGATAVGDGATTAATAVGDGATASADLVDRVAGQLLGPVFEMLTNINIPAAGTAGSAFIESIVGAQVDSVLLILQGLMTVGAGAAVVANSGFVISQLISLLNILTKFALAGAGGTVLYCIGVATNLLLKHLNVLGRMVNAKFIRLNRELRDLTTSINENPDETALPRLIAFIRKIMETLDGADVADVAAVADFIGPLQAVVDLAAHMEEEEEEEEGLPAPQPPAPALEEVPLPMNVQGAQGNVNVAVGAQGNVNVADGAQAAAAAQGNVNVAKRKLGADGTLGGGKKRAKSQKKPRKKASKSKRSKKAGKKTRKRSRGKSHGKSRGKKH
jgi:hypothetical protein